MSSALLTGLLFACIIRGPLEIDAQSDAWKAAAPMDRYEWVWNARHLPSTAAAAEPLMAELAASNDPEQLWRVAAYRWWMAEEEPDSGKKARGLAEARTLLARTLALDPSNTGAHYYAAQLLFTEAKASHWTAENRSTFFALLDRVNSAVPGFDDRGAYALAARSWLFENEVRKAAAEVRTGFLLGGNHPSGLGPRLKFAEVISAHRTTPRNEERVQFALSRLFSGCGHASDGARVTEWLKPDWRALTGAPWRD